MKRRTGATLAALAVPLAAWAGPPVLGPGSRIEAGSQPIDLEIGHLVPVVADWNGDGKKDLIVGQFQGGMIRLYLNRGTDAAPAFTDSVGLAAGGKEIRLPAG